MVSLYKQKSDPKYKYYVCFKKSKNKLFFYTCSEKKIYKKSIAFIDILKKKQRIE